VCILVLLSGSVALAQFEAGTVTGKVQDASGAVIPNAQVELKNSATGVVRTAQSSSTGKYDFINVPPGKYTVTGKNTGFANVVQNVEVSIGERVEADLNLSAAGASTVVDVNAANLESVETASSDIGNVTTTQQIVDLPLNSRNFTQLVSLSPGVNLRGSSNNSTNGGYTSARGANGAVVNGNPAEDTVFLFDGIQSVNNDVAVAIFFPPVDTIQEFKVQTSGAPPAYGGAPAIINVGFRSGTNQVHGTAYEFLRNQRFDAKNYFDDPKAPIVPFTMNQFGGNLSGPVVIPHILHGRDRLFFFADYEGKRATQAQTYISTLPTPAFVQGDFSALLPSKQLKDPRTGGPIPGNILPASLRDPVAAKLATLFPAPNRAGLVNNYLYNGSVLNNLDQGDLRVDYRTDKTSVFGRFSKEAAETFSPGLLPAPALGGGPQRPGTTSAPGEQIVLGYGRTIGTNKYYEARFGWSRLNETTTDTGSTLGPLAAQYGIPNANINGQNGLTNFSIANYVGLGDGFGNLKKIDNNYEIDQAFSWSKGNHEIKLGFDWQSRRQAKQDPLYPVGRFVFSNTYSGDAFADFLIGHATSSEIDVTPFTSLKRYAPSFYLQDSWRATPKLTLIYGLRDDMVTPWHERHNRMAGFLPATGTLVPVCSAPFTGCAVTKGRYTNWGPRFGFAYAIDQKTVLRGGAGIYYAFQNIASGQSQVQNAPFATTYTTSSSGDIAGFNAAATIASGFPAVLPQTSSNVIYYAYDYKNATSNEFNLDVQRELFKDTILSVAYVGQTAAHILYGPNINQPTPGPGAVAARRPYPNFNTVQQICMCANSAFNSLQVQLRSHFSNTLDFLGSYTYGHSIDTSSGTGNTVAAQDPRNFGSNYRGNSDFDIRHAASMSWTYTLPFGRGQYLGRNVNRVADLLVGGWQINTIQTFQTGTHYTPVLATSALNTAGSVQYPDRIGSGKIANASAARWFNPNDFACPGTTVPVPASGCGTNYRYGNSGRNILTGPGTAQVDLSGFKNFYINTDRTRYVQFRAEAFNVLNTPQFNNPNASIGNAAAGSITSAGTPLLFQRTSREIQLAGKLYF
jgi:hypothetical protein